MNILVCNTEVKNVDGLYCLNDLHKASGGAKKKKTAEFLRSDKTKALVQALESEVGNPASLKVVQGGRTEDRGTYACKELVYAYAMWISPEFHIHVIRAYDAMVTGGQEFPHTAKDSEALVRLMGKDIAQIWDQIAELEADIPEILEATARKLRGAQEH